LGDVKQPLRPISAHDLTRIEVLVFEEPPDPLLWRRVDMRARFVTSKDANRFSGNEIEPPGVVCGEDELLLATSNRAKKSAHHIERYPWIEPVFRLFQHKKGALPLGMHDSKVSQRKEQSGAHL